jgi:glycerol-3-phosphate dehydrogenase
MQAGSGRWKGCAAVSEQTIPHYDMAIIGGGINGAGIARDAAGRGLRVLLLEKGDLAGATSSSSSKLVHGGLRYLEHYEFRLVREALAEREVLMGIAPHIIWPLRFVLPHGSGMRPTWMIRSGLFLYDSLAKRQSLQGSQTVKLASGGAYGDTLQSRYATGFAYTDCWVDDARLVVLNARDAADHGAHIRTRAASTAVAREADKWRVHFGEAGEQATADVLVNAAGPWVNDVVGMSPVRTKGHAKLVKGSHIVVPRVHEGEHAYILQLPDGRIQFILPFEQEFSLIGTTDVGYEGDPAEVAITEEEVRYLLDGANAYLAKPLTREDVVWSYAGVRALYDDDSDNLSKMTRDYVLELDAAEGAPMLSIFGGKITTYRRLAEHAMQKLQPHLPTSARHPWTGTRPLPGGESAAQLPDWLPQTLAARWQRQYGCRAEAILGDATSLAELGEEIAPQVYEAELRYARTEEWALHGNDFLWRRTKLGLVLEHAERARIHAWFDAQN